MRISTHCNLQWPANLLVLQVAEESADAPEEPQEAQGDSQASFAPQEGFGTAFKCLAVTQVGQAPPFPFQADP